jgi:hypothetical protein
MHKIHGRCTKIVTNKLDKNCSDEHVDPDPLGMIMTNKATAAPYIFLAHRSVWKRRKAGEDHERERRMNMVKQGSDICIIITTVLSE